MNIENIKKDYKEDLKTVQISIRTNKAGSKFMKDNGISPTKLFNEALKEIRDKVKSK